jgi:NAD(P)-dependent dehydrogenase (short-subunit alcohol dehydrogenase family)
MGLSQSFARAGASHDISLNTIAPAAGTAMSRSVMTEEMVQAMKPEWSAPFVVVLCVARSTQVSVI